MRPLSVLQIAPDEQYALYDGESAIMTGTEEECFFFKDGIETAQQQVAVHTHLEALRRKYIVMLMQGGHTEEEANEFLKKRMPKLYEC